MEFNIGWPEGIWIGLWLFNLSFVAVKHGDEKEPSKWNFPLCFMGALLSFLLLLWGGFFS